MKKTVAYHGSVHPHNLLLMILNGERNFLLKIMCVYSYQLLSHSTSVPPIPDIVLMLMFTGDDDDGSLLRRVQHRKLLSKDDHRKGQYKLSTVQARKWGNLLKVISMGITVGVAAELCKI